MALDELDFKYKLGFHKSKPKYKNVMLKWVHIATFYQNFSNILSTTVKCQVNSPTVVMAFLHNIVSIVVLKDDYGYEQSCCINNFKPKHKEETVRRYNASSLQGDSYFTNSSLGDNFVEYVTNKTNIEKET